MKKNKPISRLRIASLEELISLESLCVSLCQSKVYYLSRVCALQKKKANILAHCYISEWHDGLRVVKETVTHACLYIVLVHY